MKPHEAVPHHAGEQRPFEPTGLPLDLTGFRTPGSQLPSNQISRYPKPGVSCGLALAISSTPYPLAWAWRFQTRTVLTRQWPKRAQTGARTRAWRSQRTRWPGTSRNQGSWSMQVGLPCGSSLLIGVSAASKGGLRPALAGAAVHPRGPPCSAQPRRRRFRGPGERGGLTDQAHRSGPQAAQTRGFPLALHDMGHGNAGLRALPLGLKAEAHDGQVDLHGGVTGGCNGNQQGCDHVALRGGPGPPDKGEVKLAVPGSVKARACSCCLCRLLRRRSTRFGAAGSGRRRTRRRPCGISCR